MFNPFTKIKQLEQSVAAKDEMIGTLALRLVTLEKHLGLEYFNGNKQKPHYRAARNKNRERVPAATSYQVTS